MDFDLYAPSARTIEPPAIPNLHWRKEQDGAFTASFEYVYDRLWEYDRGALRDVGFGLRKYYEGLPGYYHRVEFDPAHPRAAYPSLLPDMPAIRIARQPIEYSISDKAHAAFKHAGSNTRLRDYYDLYVYLTKCAVDDDRLRTAFARSWPMYGAAVPGSIDEIAGYGEQWATANAAAFRAVRDASRWAVPVPELPEIVALIRNRLAPVLAGPLHGHRR